LVTAQRAFRTARDITRQVLVFVQADHFLDRLSYPIVVEGGGSLFFLLALIPFVSAPSSVS